MPDDLISDVPGRVETLADLEALYRPPGERAAGKTYSTIDAATATFIDRCPFLVLATSDGAGSVDASPRGGPPGFVRRLDDRHVALADLNGNNRLDSFRNVVAHPWVGLLLIVPGNDETLRINGPAALTTDPDILAGFTAELRTPKVALVVATAEIYGHCAKAFRRSALWDTSTWHRSADAPDLAALYACTWGLDEEQMRAELAASYVDDLSRD